jgi:hypothetical protein
MHGSSYARKTSSAGGCIFNAAARKAGAVGSPLARLASEQQLGGLHLQVPVHYVAAAAGGVSGGGNSSGYSARYKHRASSKLLMAVDAGNKTELQASPTAADMCGAASSSGGDAPTSFAALKATWQAKDLAGRQDSEAGIGVTTPCASGTGAPASDAFAAALEQQQQHWAADCALLLKVSTAGGVAPSTPTVSAGGSSSTQQSPDGGAEQQSSSETLSLRSKYGQARAGSGRKVQEQQPPQHAAALHVVVMAPPQLPCSSSVVSLPDCTAAGGGRGASESCNGGIQQQSAAKVEGMLEQTRSVPFELVLSPRGSTAGNMCIDARSALGQQLLAMLASGGQQQLQQHPSAGAAGPTQLLIDSLLQPVAAVRPGATASFESATPPSTLDGTAAAAVSGDAEAAELAAELTALLRPDASCLSPQEKAQRVAATFVKTMSRRLNL